MNIMMVCEKTGRRAPVNNDVLAQVLIHGTLKEVINLKKKIDKMEPQDCLDIHFPSIDFDEDDLTL